MKNKHLRVLVILLGIAFMAGACDKVVLKQEQPTSPEASWEQLPK
jgi:hypothetical protein